MRNSKREKLKKIAYKIVHHKHKYINGSKGVISIFLSLLIIPFTAIAASLINVARINSAAAIFDEALCNASNSTLGTYDEFLKERFGLLAMNQIGDKSYTAANLLNETFKFYLGKNTGVLSNTYENVESTSTGIYPLADRNILQTQILEYGKYSVPEKLVVDGLKLDELIQEIENCIPGIDIINTIVDIVKGSADVATAAGKLATNIEKLIVYMTVQSKAMDNYKAKHKGFNDAVNEYLKTKKEMGDFNATYDSKDKALKKTQEDLEILELSKNVAYKIVHNQTKFDDIEWGSNVSDDEKKKVKAKLEAYNKNIDNITEQNYKQIKDEYDNASETYKADNENFDKEKKKHKENTDKFNKLKETVEKKQQEYKDAILAFKDCSTNIVATLKDITSNIKEMKGSAKDLKDTATQNSKDKDNEECVDTVVDAAQSSIDGAMNDLHSENERHIQDYNNAVDVIKDIYATVNNFSLERQSGSLGDGYYKEISNLLNHGNIVEISAKIAGELVSGLGFNVLKAIIGFIKALFDMKTLANNKLGANIDMDYYKNDLGGLPGDKDYDTGNDDDAKLSRYYKSVFGDYSMDADGLSEEDIMQKISNIFENINTIADKAKIEHILESILNLSTTIQIITDAINNICSDIGAIISGIWEYIAERLSKKLMLCGYINYTFSNRVSYDGGTSLTGQKFTKYSSAGDTSDDSDEITLIAIIKSIIKSITDWTSGEDKRFVGAEQEYIIGGTNSEVRNQLLTFLLLYGMRLVFDLGGVLTNTGVASMAAKTGPFAPLVYVIIALLEPMVDSILLVNGNEVSLIKTSYVYLTPRGIPKLLQDSNLGEELENALSNLNSGVSDSSSGQESSGSKSSSIFKVNYSKMMFLAMCVFPTDTLLRRSSNLIQMEATDHYDGKGTFDLGNSYTYIRTQAKFKTNEFISISDNLGFNVKERVVYKGY